MEPANIPAQNPIDEPRNRDKHRQLKIHLIGVYILLAGVALSLGIVMTYTRTIFPPTIFADNLLRYLIYIGFSGGIGGVVSCARAFYRYNGVSKHEFDLSWTWWYIMRPFIGIAVGLVAFFLLVAGLLTFGTTQTQFILPLEFKQIALFCAVAFLVGHSFASFDNKLEELVKTLFGQPEKDEIDALEGTYK